MADKVRNSSATFCKSRMESKRLRRPTAFTCTSTEACFCHPPQEWRGCSAVLRLRRSPRPNAEGPKRRLAGSGEHLWNAVGWCCNTPNTTLAHQELLKTLASATSCKFVSLPFPTFTHPLESLSSTSLVHYVASMGGCTYC